MSDTGNISDGGYVGMQSPDGQWTWDGAQWAPTQQQAESPKRRPVGLIVGALAVLAVIIIGAALYGNQQRDSRINHENDQISHCIDLIASGVPNDQLPSYCN